MADKTSNLETIYHNQMQANLVHALDSAVQVGDINAARKATQGLSELAITQAKNANPQFTNADIRAALKVKAPWFGVDPRRSARAVEFGKNMEPQSFKSADAFADELIRAIAEEFEMEEPEPEEDDEEKEENKENKIARRKTDAPSGEITRAVPRRSSGPWAKLSDAPKDVADTIKNAADKFTRNASKEQREKYIATALGTAYAADQRSRTKK
jgi:hypothetical protein